MMFHKPVTWKILNLDESMTSLLSSNSPRWKQTNKKYKTLLIKGQFEHGLYLIFNIPLKL